MLENVDMDLTGSRLTHNRSKHRPRLVSLLIALLATTSCFAYTAEKQPTVAERTANSAMQRWPYSCIPTTSPHPVPRLGEGMLLEGMDAIWYNTADRRYYDYVKLATDRFIDADGALVDNSPASLSDESLLGMQLLFLYRVTLQAKYYSAALSLNRQLSKMPSMSERDLYIAAPFLAGFAAVSQRPEAFTDVTRRFEAADRVPHSGKDAADVAWHLAALVNTLPYYSRDNPERAILLGLLSQVARSAGRLRNLKIDSPFDLNSFLIANALAKGVRLGYLPASYVVYAKQAWQASMAKTLSFNTETSEAPADFAKAAPCSAEGQFYSQDDAAAQREGARLQAAVEMELTETAAQGRGKRVLVDQWLSSAMRETPAGTSEHFHYKWEDLSDSGFSFFGQIFRSYGVSTDILSASPTVDNLSGAQFYIIVSPDTVKKNPHPNFLRPEDAAQVAQWVKQGGVLILMANDGPNTEIKSLDLLADRFGIHFNNVLTHHVEGDTFSMGRLQATADGVLFHQPHTLYMKDTCTISLRPPAVSKLETPEGVFIATAKYGRGTIFAVVDPWLYNEYTDGRKLPADYDNFGAAKELVGWLLRQAPENPHRSSPPADHALGRH